MNTAIAQLMTLVNALYDNGGATKVELETVVQLLNPFAPLHMTEELWSWATATTSSRAYYPRPSTRRPCVESTVEIAVQVNGKVKACSAAVADTTPLRYRRGQGRPAVAAALEGKQLVKERSTPAGRPSTPGRQGLRTVAPLEKA